MAACTNSEFVCRCSGDRIAPFPCLIGQRKESTDKKTSLEAALRDFNVAV